MLQEKMFVRIEADSCLDIGN